MNKIQVPEKPYDLAWDITAACNLSCRFCYNVSGKADPAETPELMDLIVENIVELQPLHLGIGGGEPLLSPYIEKILQTIVESMGKKTPMITINSMEICNHEPVIELVRTLNEALPEERIGFYISVHGMEHIHDATVGRKGHFKKVMKSVELLKTHEIHFGVGVVPTKYNIGELEAVLAFALDVGATLFNVSQFVPVGRGQQQYNLTPEEYNALISWVKMQNDCLNSRYVITQERWMGIIDEELFHNELFVGCSAGIYYLGLRPNGDIVPCQLNTCVLDNVRTNRLKDVWLNNHLLKAWRERQVKNPCSTCLFLYKCGGCRCNAVAYTGDFLGEDPLCPFTQTELDERYTVMHRTKPSQEPLSELLDVSDDFTVLKVPTLSTTQGDVLIIRHEPIDAYVELTGYAKVIYELLSEDMPIPFGDVKKQFKERTGREMPLDEFSDLVKHKLIEVHQ